LEKKKNEQDKDLFLFGKILQIIDGNNSLAEKAVKIVEIGTKEIKNEENKNKTTTGNKKYEENKNKTTTGNKKYEESRNLEHQAAIKTEESIVATKAVTLFSQYLLPALEAYLNQFDMVLSSFTEFEKEFSSHFSIETHPKGGDYLSIIQQNTSKITDEIDKCNGYFQVMKGKVRGLSNCNYSDNYVVKMDEIYNSYESLDSGKIKFIDS